MKKTAMIFMIMIFSVITLNAEITKLDTLGQSPFYGWVENAEAARQLVKDEIGSVKYALNMLYGIERGNKIFFALCEQIDEAEIWQMKVYPGESFEWMLFKSRGFQRVLKNVEWAGDDNFEAFAFYCTGLYKRYLFGVPQICGNISLLGVVEFIGVETKEPEVEEKIVKLEEPEIIEEELVPIETSSPKKPGKIIDMAALLARSCYGKYLPVVRLGAEYSLNEKTSIVATAGLAMPLGIRQRSTWQPFFIADISLRYKFSKLFSLGAGAGFSSTARRNKVGSYGEAVTNIGFNVTKSTILFFETRIPFCKLKDIGNFPDIMHKFVFGIRYSYK